MADKKFEIKTNIREYAEEYPVTIEMNEDNDRLVIKARNQGGYDCVFIDLMDVIKFYEANKRDI